MTEKKEYVSVSARIPKAAFEKLCVIKEELELTTNQIIAHAIDDWVTLATQSNEELTHRLTVARFSLSIKKKGK